MAPREGEDVVHTRGLEMLFRAGVRCVRLGCRSKHYHQANVFVGTPLQLLIHVIL